MKARPLRALAALQRHPWLLLFLVPALIACTSSLPMPSSPTGAPPVAPTDGAQPRLIATSGPTEADQFATVLAAASPTPQRATTPAAAAYLETALTIMQQHALHRATTDWPTLRARAASRRSAGRQDRLHPPAGLCRL